MSSPEQMNMWRGQVNSTTPQPQTAGTTISTTGIGTFDQPDPFMFGYAFINKPVMTYGCELDNYDPDTSRAVSSTGYTYGWIIDDQGLYVGAYVGVRVIDADPAVTVTHDFHFRELAVKNILNTPDIPVTYATGAPGNPAPADGGLLNVSLIDPTPIVAPTVSPTLTAYGMPSSIVLKSTVVDPTVQIEYHVSTSSFTPVQGDPTTMVTRTRSMVEVVTALPNGTLLEQNTPYYFHAIATNAAGSATPSAEVVSQLDPTAVEDVIATNVFAGFILAGLIQVGNITIDPNGGIQIPLSNGGLISLPADGSAAQFLRVVLQATSLIVENYFELRGSNNLIAGALSLSIGATTPQAGPSVAALAWTDPSVRFQAASSPSFKIGMGIADNGTEWVGIAGSGQVVGVNKTTGAVTTRLASLGVAGGTPGGGVAFIGSSYYVAVRAGTAISIRQYDSSWTFLNTYTGPAIPANCDTPSLSSDGTNLFWGFLRWNTDGKVLVYQTTPTGGSPTLISTTSAAVDTSGNTTLGAFWYGTADFGAARFITVPHLGASGSMRVWDTSSSAVRQSTQEWAFPNGDTPLAFVYDGTNFRHFNIVDKVYKLSPVVASTARSVRYSQFDSVGTTHETAWSPATAYTQAPRTWFTVVTAPPSLGGADDPNSIRHYVQNSGAGSYFRQADITASPWTGIYGAPSTAGATAVSSPDFTGVSNPGVILSSALDTNSFPMIQLQGNGKWRLAASGNIGDSGWISLTPDSGFAATAGAAPAYKLVEDRISFRGKFSPSSGNFATNATVTLVSTNPLPTAARPSFRRDFQAAGSSAAGTMKLLVNTDGSIQIVTGGTASSYASLDGCDFYL